jgi:hypothetical protein
VVVVVGVKGGIELERLKYGRVGGGDSSGDSRSGAVVVAVGTVGVVIVVAVVVA